MKLFALLSSLLLCITDEFCQRFNEHIDTLYY